MTWASSPLLRILTRRPEYFWATRIPCCVKPASLKHWARPHTTGHEFFRGLSVERETSLLNGFCRCKAYCRIRAIKPLFLLLACNFKWLRNVWEWKQIGMPNALNVSGGSTHAVVRSSTDHTEIKSQPCRESKELSSLHDFIGKPFKWNLPYDVGRHQELTLYKHLRKMKPKIFGMFRYV